MFFVPMIVRGQNELRHKGISSVYERNGQIVEELPDGSCVPLAAEAC